MKYYNLLFINSKHDCITVVRCNHLLKALNFYNSIPLISEDKNHKLVFCEDCGDEQTMIDNFEIFNKMTLQQKKEHIEKFNPDYIELLPDVNFSFK